MTTQTNRGLPHELEYDEMRHAGVDYADAAIAEEYDERHGSFRDYQKEAERVAGLLGLGQDSTVIDFGCGTGAFAIPAASVCREIHAVDVSAAMLAVCQKKADAKGLKNIVTHHAGFLSYVHAGEPVDAIQSVAALHHLPDFWKSVALARMHGMLKPGGRLYLFDVVFTFPVREYASALTGWVKEMRQKASPEMAAETATHIRDEFSTYDWVLDEMLHRAGFEIRHKSSSFPYTINYLCRRIDG